MPEARAAVAAAVLAAVLASCSAPGDESRPPKVAPPAAATGSAMTPSPSPSAIPGDRCEPVDEATLAVIRSTTASGQSHSGTWDRMVYVGAGNTPGEDWWVVGVLWGYPPGAALHVEGRPLELAAYVTNQPGLPAGQTGQAIRVGTPDQQDWSGVLWDSDRLDRGVVAAREAFACVKAVAPQE